MKKSSPIEQINKKINNLGISDKVLKLLHKKNEVKIKHLSGSLLSFFVASLFQKRGQKIFFCVANKAKALDLYNDLALIISSSELALLNSPDKTFINKIDQTENNLGWMIESLSKSLENENLLSILTPEILELELPTAENIIKDQLTIKKGQALEFDDFVKSLILNGFEKRDYVVQQGDIAIRGGIVDIFPVSWDNPIRLEFWGDEIDSIREFNSLSQRSIFEHEEVSFIGNVYHKSANEKSVGIFDYISEQDLLIIDETEPIENIEALKNNNNAKLFINSLGKVDLTIKSSPQPTFKGSVKNLAIELRKISAYDSKIIICADGKIHLERLRDILIKAIQSDDMENEDLDITPSSPQDTLNNIIWLNQTFAEGFEFTSEKICLFTEHQIFGRQKVTRRTKSDSKSITLKELQQLNPGDYVVHEDKGIGRFEGFETVKLGGSLQDCVKLSFAGGDSLFVHLNYINKIQKYAASEGVLPKLSKLGSAEWSRKKTKAKKKLKDIARDLIKLYAKRKAQKGYSFPNDDVWQQEFEASFIYEDTPDQATSTEDIKKDMESGSPMDRLVCGDVGFGKTEVAMRAAFKAVQAGKQVAVLVPTTILAQQHYMTFKDRLHDYPINVDAISRFRTPKQQRVILENLVEGKLDILIGTHRLLSKDIKFKNLGLLIIDEEHRFGVKAKEQLRELKVNIDTLTLTATPIPRTLNFSLMGARDLSVIETPPRNRIPVVTEILEWEEDKLIDAIESEMERGGQIFFVNDRIDDLEKIASNIKMLFPSIQYGIAHGQMKPSEIEKTMENFIQGKYDILITTKIVESGIDIPNANTMFINRAQNFGLAELYQLRGRVGRANKQAYCYLLIPPAAKLPKNALKRLQAIEEFTDLGSGFQLAMRDLEIRGAGNLLGGEQSGFIVDIGFELFNKILDEAVQELRENEFSDLFGHQEKDVSDLFTNEEISIELDEDSLFPNDYIRNETERFSYYKQMFKLKSHDDLNDLVSEIKDKYGKLPKEAQNLVFAVKVRISAMATGFNRVIIKQDKLVCEFPHEENKSYYDSAFPVVIDYIREIPEAQLKQIKSKLTVEIPIYNRDHAAEYLWKIKKTIEFADV